MTYASGAKSNNSRSLRRSRSSSSLLAASASLCARSSSSARRSSSKADMRSSRSSRITGASAISVAAGSFPGLLPESRVLRENSRRSSAVGCGPRAIILRLGEVTSGLSLPGTCGCNYGAEPLNFFHALQPRLRSPREVLEKLVSLATRRGLIVQSSEIQDSNAVRKKTKRHGEIRASFASVRPEQSVVAVVRFARPSTHARCFTTLSTRDSGLFTRDRVRGSFLVGGAPTLRSDCALRLRIHRCESAGSLATHTACIACLRSALSSRPADRSTTSASHSAAAYAALFHPVPFLVGLVCHYRSPAAIFEFVSRDRVEIRPASGGLSGGGPRLSE